MDHGQLETGLIRKVWPAEHTKLTDHFRRLDPESRRLRFGSPVNNSFIESYGRTLDNAPGIIHGFFVDGDLRAAAELRPLPEARSTAAEIALSVERHWQDGGIGTRLLEQTLRSARNRNISTLWMICLRENLRMQRIARKFEAELHLDPGGISGTVDAAEPNIFSLWREGFDDSASFVTAMIHDTLRQCR